MLSRFMMLAGLAVAAACNPGGEPTTSPDVAAGPASATSGPVVALQPERMFGSLEHFASDELRGRYTRTADAIGAAADHVQTAYEAVGIAPVGASYRVPYELKVGTEPGRDLHFWLETGTDVIEVPMTRYASLANGGGTAAFGSVVFAGTKTKVKGIEGKVVLARLGKEAATEAVTKRAKALEAAGASAVVLIVPARPTTPDPVDVAIPLVVIPEADAAELLELDGLKAGATLSDVKISLAAQPVPVTEPSFNVLGWIEGSEHPEEIVLLGAHLDHIGTGESGHFCQPSPGGDENDDICNGADDNASGSAMVLEIARALGETKFKPKRSLVFAHFSGEEMGLLGSEALANKPPTAAPFAEGKVVAMINLDMVGRYREEEGLQIGAISSSDGWRGLIDAAGDQGLRRVFERSVTGRSDHANFYRQKIPVVFFFTGLHSDYHRAGDHADKINREGMAAIARIVSSVTMAVADGAQVEWAEPRSDAEGVVSRLPASDASTVESD